MENMEHFAVNHDVLVQKPELICNQYERNVEVLFERGLNTTRFVCGVELEIEEVNLTSSGLAWCNQRQISVEEDGSLRNNGKEFLLPPNYESDQVSLFTEFHNKSPVRYGKNAFSSRTSTHVHVNVNYMTRPQVKTLMLLYSIFEPLAFQFCGEQRKANIHCVPLSYTHLPSLYSLDIVALINKWSKYTALNLIPVKNLGTVEFRHLGGTNNPDVFQAWLSFLSTLYNEAFRIGTFRQTFLKSPYNQLKAIEQQLLTPEFRHFSKSPIEFSLDDNLLDVKLQYL